MRTAEELEILRTQEDILKVARRGELNYLRWPQHHTIEGRRMRARIWRGLRKVKPPIKGWGNHAWSRPLGDDTPGKDQLFSARWDLYEAQLGWGEYIHSMGGVDGFVDFLFQKGPSTMTPG